jgi:hypothetical protein
MKHPVYGQMVTFAIEKDEDVRLKQFRTIPTRPGDTALRIAKRNGNPEDAPAIVRMNRLGSIYKVIRHKPRRKKDKLTVKVPGNFRSDLRFDAMPEGPPQITDGYAKFSVVDRPDRKGIPKFEGYDPAVMTVPIRFEAFRTRGNAPNLEIDCALLERMAGRGQYSGTAAGPPAIINVSTTNGGMTVPLIPLQWQRSEMNPQGPLWRVTGLTWGEAVRDGNGVLLRQLATVTLTEHVRPRLQTVAQRNKHDRRLQHDRAPTP